MDEADAKRMLAAAGIIIPKGVVVADEIALAKAVQEVGFPIVIKGQGFAHKTEAGAVALGINSLKEAASIAAAMPCDQWLVEAEVTDVVAELLISVLHDPVHGYLLTIAAGGTLAELLDDRQHLMLPVQTDDVHQALRRLRCYAVITGYRGRASAAISPIIDAVLAVQQLAVEQAGRVTEIEINPLLCTPTQAIAADALISVLETTT